MQLIDAEEELKAQRTTYAKELKKLQADNRILTDEVRDIYFMALMTLQITKLKDENRSLTVKVRTLTREKEAEATRKRY